MLARLESWLAVFCTFALLNLAGCRRGDPPPTTETPFTVRVRKAERVVRQVAVAASGSVEAKETAAVGFLVSGRVARVLAEEGQAVMKGQVLAELDPRDYQFGADAASAQTQAARAVSDKAQAGARRQEVAQAKVDLDRTADEYGRLKILYERKSLAPNDFQKIEAAYSAAKERYSMAAEGARQEDKSAAAEQWKQAQAGEGAARKNLAETKLRAPISGIVARRDVSTGEMTGPARTAFVLMAMNPVKVRVAVPEADIGKVRIGQRAEIVIPSLGERAFAGRVETAGVAAEAQSRTFPVKIAVANPKLLLRSGMVAEARIETQAKIAALTLPGEAIVRDPQGATLVYVYFPEKKRVYARRVDVGTVYGREVEIVKGLSGDELVVVAGQQLATEGALVAVQEGGR